MHADRVRLRRPRLVLGHAETNAACPAKAAAVHGAAAIRATTLDEAQTRRHPPRRAASRAISVDVTVEPGRDYVSVSRMVRRGDNGDR